MRKALPLIIFTLLLVAWRVLAVMEVLPNLQAFGALFFLGAACFGTRWLWVPAIAWFASYPITSAMQGYGWSSQLLLVLVGFAAMIGIGLLFRKRSAWEMFGGSLLAATAFYLLTNLGSWAFDPRYSKTLEGLVAALWTGLPGDAVPTWAFFRNSLVSTGLFSAIFLVSASAPMRLFLAKLRRQLAKKAAGLLGKPAAQSELG